MIVYDYLTCAQKNSSIHEIGNRIKGATVWIFFGGGGGRILILKEIRTAAQ